MPSHTTQLQRLHIWEGCCGQSLDQVILLYCHSWSSMFSFALCLCEKIIVPESIAWPVYQSNRQQWTTAMMYNKSLRQKTFHFGWIPGNIGWVFRHQTNCTKLLRHKRTYQGITICQALQYFISAFAQCHTHTHTWFKKQLCVVTTNCVLIVFLNLTCCIHFSRLIFL